jgi:hypothetical protein
MLMEKNELINRGAGYSSANKVGSFVVSSLFDRIILPDIKSRVVKAALQLFFVVIPVLLHPNMAYAQLNNAQVELDNTTVVSSPSVNQWGPPYPFTAEELQQKLVQVLRIPANDLSKEIVEKIFDMRFQNSGKLAPDSLNYGLDPKKWYLVYSRSHIDWYFAVGIGVTPQSTNFGFGWWNSDSPPEPYTLPMCMDVQSVLKDINKLNLGWIEELPDPLIVYPHGRIPRLNFNRGKDERLNIDYLPGTNCMTALTFILNTTNGD